MKSMSMRDAINAGMYFRVHVPGWASGGADRIAETPAEAALLVGCQYANYSHSGVPLHTEVLRHLPQSRIGAAYLESCGVFPTLTADHYVI